MDLPQIYNDETWIHLMFRGEDTAEQSNDRLQKDEYLEEFVSNNLIAVNVPILKFKYHNLNQLSELLKSTDNSGSSSSGLILTSLRSIEAILMSKNTLNSGQRDSFLRGINNDLVFVVGEKSGKQCELKLNLKYNTMSAHSGDGARLAEYIKTFCKENARKFPSVNLLFPRGKIATETIENNLLGETNIIIRPIIVYEADLIEDIDNLTLKALSKLNIPNETTKLVINLILFSPQGVRGILKFDQGHFRDSLKHLFPNRQIDIKYSSIGRTTENALLENNLEVFCVSDRPSPFSLVESILKKVDSCTLERRDALIKQTSK